MPKVREDHWSEYEDKILVNTILDYIRNGKTQIQAFEDVGEVLDRSGGACSFRWNSELRKGYREEIRLARRKWRKQKLDLAKLEIPKVQPKKETKKSTKKVPNKSDELLQALNDVYKHTNNAQVKFIIGQTIEFIKKSDALTSDQ